MFYELTDAETRYWYGKTLLALGDLQAARRLWRIGATQRTSKDPKMPFIRITPAQDRHVEKCRTALELLDAAPTP